MPRIICELSAGPRLVLNAVVIRGSFTPVESENMPIITVTAFVVLTMNSYQTHR